MAMDDAAFQRELIDLKHRVSQMAASYQPSPAKILSGLTSNDAFLYHLQDVKTRLQTMQTSLNSLTSPSSRPALALPSPPLFWQLFTALRSDVRSIDTRLAGVEQDVSDLEDHVDRLDPSQVTPAASDDEVAHITTWGEHHESPFTRQQHWAYGPAVEDSRIDRTPQQQSPSELDGDYGAASRIPPLEAFSEPRHAHRADEIAAAEGVAYRDREIAQLEELVKGAHDNLTHIESMSSQKDAEIERLQTENSSYRAKLAEIRQTIVDGEARLSGYSRMPSTRQLEVEDLQAWNKSKDEAIQTWFVKHHKLQQSYMQKKSQLSGAEMQITQLQRTLYDIQGRKDETDDLIATKDHEIARLRDFCESKDAVIYQQEQIIGRGAALMEEKDDEIERLSRELKAVHADIQNEMHRKQHLSRLYEERGEVIVQLRTSLNQALTSKPIPTTRETQSPATVPQQEQRHDVPLSSSPFATIGKEVRNSHEQKWTPEPIAGYGKLPHEQERAALWESGHEAYRYSFGSPSTSQVSSQQRNNPSDLESRNPRHNASVKLLRRLAIGGETDGHNQGFAYSTNPRSEPMEYVSRRPTLPAPFPPLPPRNGTRNHATRQGAHYDHRPISKHHSMQDLPRRKLHAYVEEDDTGGERGGDA